MTYPRCYGVCQMWIIRIYPGVDYRHGYAFARGLTVQCFEVEERVGPRSVIDVVFDAGLALCLRVCRCGACFRIIRCVSGCVSGRIGG